MIKVNNQIAWEDYKKSVKFDSYEIVPFKNSECMNHRVKDICTIEEAEVWILYGLYQQDKLYSSQRRRILSKRPTKEECEQVLFEVFNTKEYNLIHAGIKWRIAVGET